MSSYEQIKLAEEIIVRLSKRIKRLRAGEELCEHSFNGSDGCYETYCTGCGNHMWSIEGQLDIPFKKDALCFGCEDKP